jgi:hypothetical protein
MTCAYNLYFVFVWSTAILAIPAAVTLLVLSIQWSIPHNHNNTTVQDNVDTHPDRFIAGYVGFAIFVVWTTLLRMHGPRVRIRAGAWPALCHGDITPETETELLAGISEMIRKTKQPPAIVGSGWGFFIKRYGPTGPRVFLHNYKGRDAFNRNRWKAGTTIAAVAVELKNEGLTFPSHPTMDYISIGSWFGFGNHGNGGDENSGSSKCLETARVLDMSNMSINEMRYPELRRAFDNDHKRYCILDVTFKGLVKNTNLIKKGLIIDSARSADAWLEDGAVLRVCFQGASRSYAIGTRWTKVSSCPIPDTF